MKRLWAGVMHKIPVGSQGSRTLTRARDPAVGAEELGTSCSRAGWQHRSPRGPGTTEQRRCRRMWVQNGGPSSIPSPLGLDWELLQACTPQTHPQRAGRSVVSERLVTPRVCTQLPSAPLPPAKQGQRCGKLQLSQVKTQTNEYGVLQTCLQE